MGIRDSIAEEIVFGLDAKEYIMFGYMESEGRKRHSSQRIENEQRYEKEKKEGTLLERKEINIC